MLAPVFRCVLRFLQGSFRPCVCPLAFKRNRRKRLRIFKRGRVRPFVGPWGLLKFVLLVDLGYSLSDITAALRGQMQGKVVSIHCFDASSASSSASVAESNAVPLYPSSNSRQYLYQVEICLDKQLEPIDCPDTGSCHDNRPIYYPPIRQPSTFSLFNVFGRMKSPILVL